MKKTVKKYRELPPEVNKTYKTKMSTGELFTVKEISYDKKGNQVIKGIFESSPHLGICPFNVERLVLDKEKIGEIEICSKCVANLHPHQIIIDNI